MDGKKMFTVQQIDSLLVKFLGENHMIMSRPEAIRRSCIEAFMRSGSFQDTDLSDLHRLNEHLTATGELPLRG